MAMLIRDRMTSPVSTIEAKTPLYDALSLMKQLRIRRLPVVRGRALVGIVTWTDLMLAHPSSATSLALWEIPRLLVTTPVRDIMTREVVTISPKATIEEAAVLMRTHKIGGLPVLDEATLVGIVTESDIFDAFIDLMGLHSGGARVTLDIEKGDELHEIVRTIRDCGVEIRSLAAYPINGHREMVVRVDAPYPLHVVQTLSERGLHVRHLAELPGSQTE